MKLVKIFVFLTVILVMLVFLMRNANRVSVDLILVQYDQVSLAVVMIFTVAIGILIGFGVSLSTILATKADNRSIRLKNRQLTEEVNNLRNVGIDDDIYDLSEEEE
ncbi:MAG: LapA family protein [Candidatus Marinimicrobia bacterium]|nr:LapA family protein [Candidatus Neomarinimicrobiota bacterium]